MDYIVTWCKDCPAIGVMKASPTSDLGVAWANAHAEAFGHRRIASLPFGRIRDLYQTAVEAIERGQTSDDFAKLL